MICSFIMIILIKKEGYNNYSIVTSTGIGLPFSSVSLQIAIESGLIS